MNPVVFKSIGRYGRFANQAFQIAGLIGIARKNGMDFALCEPWMNHNGRDFEPDLDIECYKRFVNPLPLYTGPELPQFGIAWGYWDVNLHRGVPHVEWRQSARRYDIWAPDGVDLLGHFQSEKFFAHSIDEVRWYMEMIDEGPLEDVVGLHFRAGDYGPQVSPQHPDGNSYHPRMALDYYQPAMAQFGSKQKFLVFSDDIEAAREMLGNGANIEYVEGGSYFDDFRRMKKCTHFIIANSSFSAMAAILGDAEDKQVVAPFPWFGGPYTDALDPTDIYSPGWTVVNWQNRSVKAA